MSRTFALLFALLPLISPLAHLRAADLYVATDGNDAWSGTSDAPDAGKSDGPFATLSRARDELRKHAGAGGSVWVRGGVYALPETFELTPTDSGTPEMPVIYAAYKEEKPVFSGGVKLSGFKRGADGRWTLQLPEVQQGKWAFTQLFVNGQRRQRPRLPKDSYYFIAAAAAPTAGIKGVDRFRFNPGEIKADWSNRENIDVLVFHNWCMSRLPVANVDEAGHIVTLAGGTTNKASWHGLNAGQRYIVENVAEALQDPGEWYLDRKSGVLTYIPLPGEDPDKAEVFAPRLETLVRFTGDLEKKQWVSHVTFRGIAFEHSNWVTPPAGWSINQAEVALPGAITATGTRDCVFDHCTVSHIGHYAIELGAACRNNTVKDCELTDLGGGGIKIGMPGSRKENDELLTGWTTVYHNLIAHGGRLHPAAIGVLVLASPHNTIEANTVHDFYYTAISLGWSWGYNPSAAHDNTVLNNNLTKLGQNVLSDMGGIYTLGLSDGTVLRGNRMGEIESNSYGGWGIYFDEGTTHITAENNVVYHTKTGGFHQHYGRENRVVNNIFYSGREQQLQRTRAEEHLSFTFEHNIVAWEPGNGAVLNGRWGGPKQNALDSNLYWLQASPADWPGPIMGKLSFKQWQESGEDQHSILADPGFVDAAHLDFRLKPDSPAAKVGFNAGAIADAAMPPPPDPRLSGNVPPAWPLKTPPKPHPPISDDFESTPVGQPPAGPSVREDAAVKGATVRVTDETAAAGKRSLKFTDAPGQRVNFTPHIFYEPGFTTGVVQDSFDLRLEPGAHFNHEWRSAGNPYLTGPALTILPDGSFIAGKDHKKLFMVPHSQWLHIDITCSLGDAADGRWDLAVTLPASASPQVFKGIACDPTFKALGWYGFSSPGAQKTVFYIDNIDVKPRK